jgi:hypothetical protein
LSNSWRAELSWQDNFNNESGFKIERKTGISGTYRQIALVPANAVSYCKTKKCSISSAANGAIKPCPDCSIVCNSGYVFSGSVCVLKKKSADSNTSSNTSGNNNNNNKISDSGGNSGAGGNSGFNVKSGGIGGSKGGAGNNNAGEGGAGNSGGNKRAPTSDSLNKIREDIFKVQQSLSEILRLIKINPKSSGLLERLIRIKNSVAELLKRLNKIKSERGGASSANFLFQRNLHFRSRGENVRKLQEILSQDKEVYPQGLVTGYFGPLTYRAVIRFQEKYAEEILKPLGFKKRIGFVGFLTRKKLNEILNR